MSRTSANRPLALVVAGGTGGHLYPGIAVARAFREAASPWDVLFVVRRGDLGRDVLEREGFAVQEITGQGLPRSINLRLLTFPFRFLSSCCDAWKMVRQRQPRVVVGMGGYLSFPVLLAARLQGIPTFIHEQNVLPGLSNRMLARWVNAVAASFPDSVSRLKARQVWVSGLPVRQEIGTVSALDGKKAFGLDPAKITVFIFGGSQGAHRLNEQLLATWRKLSPESHRFQVLHVTGSNDQAAVESAYRSLPLQAQVLGYCHDMPSAYAAADLVICRAGASTVAELLAAERPSILIPFPYASENHQVFNARVLEKAGLAEVIEEKHLDPEALASHLRKLLAQPGTLAAWQSRFASSSLKTLSRGASTRFVQFITQAIQLS